MARARAQLKAGLLMGLESPSAGPSASRGCWRSGAGCRMWTRRWRRSTRSTPADVRGFAGGLTAAPVGAGALRPGRRRAGARGDPRGACRLMLGLRRRVRIETERMTLRLPQHADFRAWAALREASRRVPDAVGAGLGHRPSGAQGLHQPGLLGARAPSAQGTALPLLLIRREDQRASGRDHAGQHPPRPGAGGNARLLDRRSPSPGRATCARRSWRWSTTPSP